MAMRDKPHKDRIELIVPRTIRIAIALRTQIGTAGRSSSKSLDSPEFRPRFLLDPLPLPIDIDAHNDVHSAYAYNFKLPQYDLKKNAAKRFFCSLK